MLVVLAVVLTLCWNFGSQTVAVKAIFTGLAVISQVLIFFPSFNLLYIASQFVLILFIGIATFGVDWLIQSIR